MRIIGGRFKGRGLKTPTDHTVRPTSDRLRETLFNILAHAYDDPMPDARVLDLFAGTGALGLEALSRGASFAQFVDDSAQGRGLLRANIENLGVAAQTKVFRRDATRMGQVHPHAPFHLIFCDPPYNKGLGDKALTSAYEGGWFAPKALIVFEESSKAEHQLPSALTLLETRDFGETPVMFLQAPDA
jgi:16S rRNA (guanine966-N2)-methyltransferase